MSDLRDLMRDAGTAPAGSATMTAQYAAVRHRIKRRRAVRATGIGSAAAVSAGAMALGVAHVLPGKPQEAGPASAVEASASADPGPVCGGGGPSGPDVLYATVDCETGAVLSTLTVAQSPDHAWLTRQEGARELLEVNDEGNFVFRDWSNGEETWVEVDPHTGAAEDSRIVVHFDGAQPDSPESEVVELD